MDTKIDFEEIVMYNFNSYIEVKDTSYISSCEDDEEECYSCQQCYYR